MDAILGYTGFVGSSIRESLDPSTTELFNSTNLGNIRGGTYKTVYCACVPAVKWVANANPDKDNAAILEILDVVKSIVCEKFVLISTIDVHNPSVQSQTELCERPADEAYGRNRYFVEQQLRSKFGMSLTIIRLPALFGIGLKKNIIYDLVNDHGIDSLNSNTCFQWYSMSWLHEDIEHAIQAEVPVLNLYPEPIETMEILQKFFPDKISEVAHGKRVEYRNTSRYPVFARHNHQVLEEMSRFFKVFKNTQIANRMVVSNMAWEQHQDDHAMFLMNKYGIRYVEILPTKYFPWEKLFKKEFSDMIVERFRKNSIEIYSLQSILYGIQGDFENNSEIMVEHMDNVANVAEKMGVQVVIIGSPTKRPQGLSESYFRESLKKLKKRGSQSGTSGPIFCLEPNAEQYGCFCGRDLDSCARIVRDTDILINFDTGNMAMEGDRNPGPEDKVFHCQISAPFLRTMRLRDYSLLDRLGPFLRENQNVKVSLEVKCEDIKNLGSQIRRFASFCAEL